MLQIIDQQTNLQRAAGRTSLTFRADSGRTRLASLHQSGCLKAILPQNHQDRPDVVLVNTAGGLTGGDRLTQEFIIRSGSSACGTTQTAERIYKSVQGKATVQTAITIDERAEFYWLPQETILFDASSLARSLTVNMAENSKCLLLESIVLGRSAMGETLKSGNHKDIWKIYREQKLVRMEAMRFAAENALNGSAMLGGATAFATLIYASRDADAAIENIRAMLNFEGVESAVSGWDGCLAIRFKAHKAQALKFALTRFLTQFCDSPLPRVWHM